MTLGGKEFKQNGYCFVSKKLHIMLVDTCILYITVRNLVSNRHNKTNISKKTGPRRVCNKKVFYSLSNEKYVVDAQKNHHNDMVLLSSKMFKLIVLKKLIIYIPNFISLKPIW